MTTRMDVFESCAGYVMIEFGVKRYTAMEESVLINMHCLLLLFTYSKSDDTMARLTLSLIIYRLLSSEF